MDWGSSVIAGLPHKITTAPAATKKVKRNRPMDKAPFEKRLATTECHNGDRRTQPSFVGTREIGASPVSRQSLFLNRQYPAFSAHGNRERGRRPR
jgi:hypothetical protein